MMDGMSLLQVFDPGRHGAGVWTLTDAAERLVSVADDAACAADVYDAIVDDAAMRTQMEIAIRAGHTSKVIPDAMLALAASAAIDMSARCLVIVSSRETR